MIKILKTNSREQKLRTFTFRNSYHISLYLIKVICAIALLTMPSVAFSQLCKYKAPSGQFVYSETPVKSATLVSCFDSTEEQSTPKMTEQEFINLHKYGNNTGRNPKTNLIDPYSPSAQNSSNKKLSEEIAVCNSSLKGYSLFADKSSFENDGIKDFKLKVLRLAKDRFDILYFDTTGKFKSVLEEEGKIELLESGRNGFSLLVKYPKESSDVYTFSKIGKKTLILQTIRYGDHALSPKSSLITGDCQKSKCLIRRELKTPALANLSLLIGYWIEVIVCNTS